MRELLHLDCRYGVVHQIALKHSGIIPGKSLHHFSLLLFLLQGLSEPGIHLMLVIHEQDKTVGTDRHAVGSAAEMCGIPEPVIDAMPVAHAIFKVVIGLSRIIVLRLFIGLIHILQIIRMNFIDPGLPCIRQLHHGFIAQCLSERVRPDAPCHAAVFIVFDAPQSGGYRRMQNIRGVVVHFHLPSVFDTLIGINPERQILLLFPLGIPSDLKTHQCAVGFSIGQIHLPARPERLVKAVIIQHLFNNRPVLLRNKPGSVDFQCLGIAAVFLLDDPAKIIRSQNVPEKIRLLIQHIHAQILRRNHPQKLLGIPFLIQYLSQSPDSWIFFTVLQTAQAVAADRTFF